MKFRGVRGWGDLPARVAAGDLTEDEVLNEREVCMRRSQILYTRYDKLDMSLSYWEKAKMGRLY